MKLKLNKKNKLYKYILMLSNAYNNNKKYKLKFGHIFKNYESILLKYYNIIILNKQGLKISKNLLKNIYKMYLQVIRRGGRVVYYI